ncbi:MAG: multidrug efflux SMR transporter [Paenirhodobacter sp.]|uniref:DMT family transporter n=1 Tax=Paenirhodobacter sp. TaxID=1965326 RepID=UPI003D0A6104
MSPWALLFIAGLCEIGWALGLKYSDGFSKPIPAVLTVVTAAISVVILSHAMRAIPVGTAYAVWSGIGALGTAIFAVILFAEPVNAMRVLGILLIVGGIAALKLA